MTMTKRDVVDAALSVAEDIGAGKLLPGDLEREVVSELTALVGQVVGADDPLFDFQCQVARGVLAVGGIPAVEIAEWAAVQRRREGGGSGAVEPARGPSPAGVDDALPEPDSSLSMAHSPETGASGGDPEYVVAFAIGFVHRSLRV